MDCICCQKPKSENLIYQSDLWKIELAADQTYLGRCYVTLQRHCGDIAEMTKDEWDEFTEIVKKLENALKKSFHSTMFNWTVLMNDAYKVEPPNPHIHWHFRPRYNHEIKVGKETFKDPNFAHHYQRGTNRKVPKTTIKKIINEIKNKY